MSFVFNSVQLNGIQQAVDLIEQQSVPDWSPAYRAVVSAIDDAILQKQVADADQANVNAVRLWFKGAALVNSGKGRFSSVIRAFTQRQLYLHGGSQSRDDVIALTQQSSNRIGEVVIKEGILGADEGKLMTMDVIAERDAQQALDIVFAGIDKADSAVRDGAAWSGAVLFPMFNKPGVTMNDESLRLLKEGNAGVIDTLEDLRNILFTIDIYSFASDNAEKMTREDFQIFMDLIFPNAKAGIKWKDIKEFGEKFVKLLLQRNGGGSRLERLLQGTAAYEPVVTVRKLGVNYVLDALCKLYGHSVKTENSEQFAEHARLLFGGIDAQGLDCKLRLLTEQDVDTIQETAKTSVAHCYALLSLAPFVIQGIDDVYEQHNYKGCLDLEHYSEETLNKKADALKLIIQGVAT